MEPVMFTCEHLRVNWPTTFVLSSDPGMLEEGGYQWIMLVDYCYGEPGVTAQGPRRVCYQQRKRVFCVRLFGRRPWGDIYPSLKEKFLEEPAFGVEFFRTNRSWVRDLTRENVESNPGPAVLSKFQVVDASDLWRVVDFVVSQGFGDLLSLPGDVSNFTRDFSRFVEKIPDKSFLDNAFSSISQQADQIISMLSTTTTQVREAFEASAYSASVLKEIIIGALVVLAFVIMARSWGVASATIVLIVSFLLHHFNMLPYLKDVVLDSGVRLYDYFKTNFVKNEVVELQAFGNPVVDALVNPDNLGGLLAALFTILFVGSVKCHPTTKDYEDFSRKIFNYQRGVTSVVASYDKLKDFWTWTVERICDRLELNTDSAVVTKFSIASQIDKWLSANTALFKKGYDHTLSMEARLTFVEEMRTQYNAGLDLVNTCDRLDRAKAAIVRFWVDKLHKKLEELGTESLEGTVRNPPTTILLYGPSGVGKSSLITSLASFCGRLHATLKGCEQPAVGSVYVRNCDQAHYDGYTNQHTLVIDDFLSRKDTESNPNMEAGELIKIKNNVPFPLPMAHLPEKGRVFNSQVVIMTTNCRNITQSLGSMNFPYATANRLTDASYACGILPPYRKYISPSQRQELESAGLFDQHSVDPLRARYEILPNPPVRAIPLDDDHLLDTYTDEEFLKMRGDLRLLPNGQIQHMNFGVYFFRKLDVKTGAIIGPVLTWTDFLNEIERVYTQRMTLGENMLEQTRWFHSTSLAHMKQGVIDVPTHVQSQMFQVESPDEFEDTSSDPLAFALAFASKNVDELYNVSNPDMCKLLDSYHQQWPDFDDKLAAYMGKSEQDEAEQVAISRWSKMWAQCKEQYQQLHQKVQNLEVMQVLRWASLVAYGITLTAGCYVAAQAVFTKIKQPNIQKAVDLCSKARSEYRSRTNWFKRLFSRDPPIKISRAEVPLSGSDLAFLFQFCGYDVVQSEAAMHGSDSAHNTVRGKKCTVYVPSHTFGLSEVQQVAGVLNAPVEEYEEGVKIDLDELQVPLFLVRLESCQLTDQSLDYILPQNSFILRAWSAKKSQKYDFGNVFFFNDRMFLMPHHYMLMLKYQLRIGNLSEDDTVHFLRGPTTLERGKKQPPNRITCAVGDLLDYAQIISRAQLDDPNPFNKDAVVVRLKNMSGHSCSTLLQKFITREEFSKLNDPGLSGYLVGQRFVSGSDECYNVALPCVDITPVNRFKNVSFGVSRNSDSDDLVGLASAGPASRPVVFSSLIRDRYNYKADTRQGDCGMVLFVESPQLTHSLVGIHVAGDRQIGRANSVPITQEDITEAIERLACCTSECFAQPELIPLTPEDVDSVVANVPKGEFHYIGKLTGKVPVQPLTTAIRPSAAQVHLQLLKDKYRARTGKDAQVEIRKAPAHLRIAFCNPEGCRVFYGKKGNLVFEDESGQQPLTPALYQLWEQRGGVFHDVLMKGLAKTSLRLPYIKPSLIEQAVRATQQRFLRMGPNSICPYEKALSQNFSDEFFKPAEEIKTEVARRALIARALSTTQNLSPKEIYEMVLRKVSLSHEEGAVFRQHLECGPDEYRDLVSRDLNALTSGRIDALLDGRNPMLLTIQQSVQGIPGDPTIRPINSKKSPGYPYSSQGLNFGKKPWVGRECKCDGELWPQLEADVFQLIEIAKTQIPPVYFVATLKDELRSAEKVQNYKTRVFCAGPMHFTIAFRMYFMRFLSFVQENRLFNESALGINYYSREWETLCDYLSEWDGPTCIAGDYTNFDGSLSNQVLEKIYDIVDAFYLKYGTTQEERNIRRNLWLCLTRSMIIGRNGCVFRLFNSQPSGNPFTTVINILFNSVVFRMAYIEIMATVPGLKRDVYNFEDDVHLISYGDDNAANINPEILPWFNMETISKQLATYGLTYTDESKQQSFVRGRNLEEINFLKRGFKRVDFFSRRWVAPLDIDTVKEMFMWMRKGDENARKTILASGVSTSLMEMALHGREAYEDWCTFVQGFEDKALLGKDMVVIPDFETQFVRVCEKDLDLDQF